MEIYWNLSEKVWSFLGKKSEKIRDRWKEVLQSLIKNFRRKSKNFSFNAKGHRKIENVQEQFHKTSSR